MLSVEREHRLKIHRKPFLDLESGAKTCEIRDCSDRDFQIGDIVLLMLVDETGNPTANELRRKITHIQTGYGLPDDLCVLSYEPAAQHQGEPVAEVEVVEGDSPHVHLYQDVRDGTKLYAEQPAPVQVPVRPRVDEDEYERMSDYEKGLLHGGIELWDKIDQLNGVKP